MIIWALIKKMTRILAFAKTDNNSPKCKLKELERVIIPKRKGIAGRKVLHTEGNRKPIKTPSGVKKGMCVSSH